MHTFKLLLLIVSCGITATLAASLWWHVTAAWNAPHLFRTTGTVVALEDPPPGDAERVPSQGPRVVVSFRDAKGADRRETYNSFNSGGRTEFAGRHVGEIFSFDLAVDGPVPGSRRRFDWPNAGKVHAVMGGALVLIGALLYAL